MSAPEAMVVALRADQGLQPKVGNTALEIPKEYVPCAESGHALYRLELESFCGPLDLLLFLIRRHTVDIFDIPIAFICARYLEALSAMEALSLDVAAEFMYMAAELLQIKSRLLLPKPEGEAEEEEEVDPRAALVARLLEYQKYQEAAAMLQARPRLGRDVFERAPESIAQGAPPSLRPVGAMALVQALHGVLKKQTPEVRHRVVVEHASVKKRMQVLVEALAERERVVFIELLGEAPARIDIILTFLAVLELTRMKLLRLLACEAGALYLAPRFSLADEALERLEGEANVDEQFA